MCASYMRHAPRIRAFSPACDIALLLAANIQSNCQVVCSQAVCVAVSCVLHTCGASLRASRAEHVPVAELSGCAHRNSICCRDQAHVDYTCVRKHVCRKPLHGVIRQTGSQSGLPHACGFDWRTDTLASRTRNGDARFRLPRYQAAPICAAPAAHVALSRGVRAGLRAVGRPCASDCLAPVRGGRDFGMASSRSAALGDSDPDELPLGDDVLAPTYRSDLQGPWWAGTHGLRCSWAPDWRVSMRQNVIPVPVSFAQACSPRSVMR